MDTEQNNQADLIFRPITGTVLAVASGLAFFFMCMILPLVGPAGSRVPHAAQNRAVFLMVLFVALALAGGATWSKLGYRKLAGGPLPWFSLGLCAVCILTFTILISGGLAI